MSARFSGLSMPPGDARWRAEPGVRLSKHAFSGTSMDELERMFDVQSDCEPTAIAVGLESRASSPRRRRQTTCVRRFLSESEGIGYWDYVKPADRFMLSVAEATYHQDHWISNEGAGFFKLRLLLTGTLLNQQRAPLLEGPAAMLHLSPSYSADGYLVAGGRITTLVVLHCWAQVLTTTLGLEPLHVPAPFSDMFDKDADNSVRQVALGPAAFHAAQQIVSSRHAVPSVLRAVYLESMAQALLCEVLSALSNQEQMRRTPSRLGARDLNRIYEVRDYLAQHFQSPPLIPQLARMVGINQSKLKEGFRQVMNVTIYQYILQRRMQRACELLSTKNYKVAEIAYLVGYEYPTNFTFAFKRHFGYLPREWEASL